MNESLRELYQEVIIEHGRHPRNFGKSFEPTDTLDGFNPLCGDQITVFLRCEADKITDIAFEGKGCAISIASASLMTEAMKGKTRSQAIALFEHFHDILMAEKAPDETLGKLAVLLGVRDYPMRVKCATLAWHTLKSILKGNNAPVSTE